MVFSRFSREGTLRGSKFVRFVSSKSPSPWADFEGPALNAKRILSNTYQRIKKGVFPDIEVLLFDRGV